MHAPAGAGAGTGTGAGTGAAAPAVAPDDVANPIPEAVIEEERVDPRPMDEAVCVEAGGALRESHALWAAMARHLRPCLGSIATELVVVVDPRQRFFVPRAGFRAPSLLLAMQRHLRGTGTDPVLADSISATVLEFIAKTNNRTLALAHHVIAHPDSTPGVVVFRLAFKPVSGLNLNVPTGAVWFNNGHANACIIDVPRRIMFVVEPTGMEFMSGILQYLADLMFADRYPEFTLMHNHGMFPREALLTELEKCTVWCAIAALLALANPVVTHADFMCVLHWAYQHQHWLLRLFVRWYRILRASGEV